MPASSGGPVHVLQTGVQELERYHHERKGEEIYMRNSFLVCSYHTHTHMH